MTWVLWRLGGRVVQVACCLAQLLHAFGHRQSFSAEAKGGGPESNMRLALALLALGRYFVACCSAEELAVGRNPS